MSNNIVLDKSKVFAIRIIRLYQFLSVKKKEFVLSKQLLRSGTSIGANVSEATRAQSRADFLAKINIALKEAAETEYWLELLYETNYIEKSLFDSLISDNNALIRILTSISKTTSKTKSIPPE